jgi:hypothetical protein
LKAFPRRNAFSPRNPPHKWHFFGSISHIGMLARTHRRSSGGGNFELIKFSCRFPKAEFASLGKITQLSGTSFPEQLPSIICKLSVSSPASHRIWVSWARRTLKSGRDSWSAFTRSSCLLIKILYAAMRRHKDRSAHQPPPKAIFYHLHHRSTIHNPQSTILFNHPNNHPCSTGV